MTESNRQWSCKSTSYAFNNVILLSIWIIHFTRTVWAQGYQYDPVDNFCRRLDHQSALVNGKLYVEGGTQSYVQLNKNGQDYSKNLTVGQLDDVLLYNLDVAWDWKTNINITELPKEPASGVKDTIPNLVRGALWSGPKYSSTNESKDILYFFGGIVGTNASWPGYTPPESDDVTLWRVTSEYGANSQKKQTLWEPVELLNKTTGQKATIMRPSDGADIIVPELNMAFYLGGEMKKGSSPATSNIDGSRFVDGMLVFEFVNDNGKIGEEKVYVRNLSTTALGSRARNNGKLVYLPHVGQKGVLVLIGGGLKSSTLINSDSVGELVPMSEIAIFDIASLDNTTDGKWYIQLATGRGNIPKSRTDHCIVVVSATDNSSHNIYLYGGRDSANGLDDIWVLSLPSFRWISLFQGADQRRGHTCHMYKDRQLLTLGGQSGLDLSQAGSCDWELKGIAVLDVSTLQWGSSFDPGKNGYFVPLDIYNIIGGNGAGNATLNSPESGWSNPQLATLFSQKGWSNTNSTVPTSKTSSSSGLSTAAKAGIVLGVLIGIAALLGLILFFLHKRKQRLKQETTLSTSVYAQPEELDATIKRPAGELMGNQEKVELPAGHVQTSEMGYGYDQRYELESPPDQHGGDIHGAPQTNYKK